MKEKIRQFMIGRYGTDGLNQFLNIASLVLILVYILTRLPLLLYVGVVLLGFCYYRMFSRNISKRTEENYKYYAVKDRIRNKFSGLKDQWDNRRLYHYYRCPQCGQQLRVPRGRGKISITCPKCGKKHSFQVWDSINTLEFPEMKEKVRNDEAFRYRCPDCGATALLNYNFLYHQQEDKILIFVDADGSSYGDMEKILKQRGNAFDGYRKRILLSYNDFKEKLLIFDAGLDDRIVEIIKSSIWDNVEERYKDKHIDEIYFATNEDGETGFLFRKEGHMVASMEFDKALYNAIKEAALSRIDAISRDDLIIDRNWAKTIVARLG